MTVFIGAGPSSAIDIASDCVVEVLLMDDNNNEADVHQSCCSTGSCDGIGIQMNSNGGLDGVDVCPTLPFSVSDEFDTIIMLLGGVG